MLARVLSQFQEFQNMMTALRSHGSALKLAVAANSFVHRSRERVSACFHQVKLSYTLILSTNAKNRAVYRTNLRTLWKTCIMRAPAGELQEYKVPHGLPLVVRWYRKFLIQNVSPSSTVSQVINNEKLQSPSYISLPLELVNRRASTRS